MTVREELEHVRMTNGGILRPKDVVDFARQPSTKLHEKFEWDDSIAGEKYRLEQARMMIRFEVRIVEDKRVPAYFSFVGDRKTGESYRAIVEILGDADLRKKMVDQALAEALAWSTRYERLAELAGIRREIRKASKKKGPR